MWKLWVFARQSKISAKTYSKLVIGTANLNVVIGSPNCVFDKDGIGFKLVYQKKKKKNF